MADIDSLSVKITANVSQAEKSIDKLETNVKRLGQALGRLNPNQLERFAQATHSMGSAMQSFKGIGNKKFESIGKGLSSIANVDASNMSTLGTGLVALSNGLTAMSNVDSKSVTRVINSLTKLGASSQNFKNLGLGALGAELNSMATNLENAPKVSRSITTLISGIARLGGVGGANIEGAANSLPAMGNAIRKLAFSLTLAPTVKAETTQLVSAIGTLSSAGSKTLTTANNLEELGKGVVRFVNELNKAPEVSDKTLRLVTALGQLASAGGQTSRMFQSIANMGGRTTSVFGRVKASVDKLTSSLHRSSGGMRDFASSVGMFYAKCWLAIRGAKTLWKAIETGMDYVETFNYFEAAFEQVSSSANLSKWKELGYASADAYAKSFEERTKEVTKSLTGFKVADNGQLQDVGVKSLGIDPNLVMNYQAQFAQMGSSMGTTADNATKLSEVLTKIGLDLASVKNLDFKATLDDMSSGLVGMSRTWDKFGVNIRVANMDTYLAEHGINATAKSLSQADKALLRTTILLDTSRYAWSDLADTINQPANQLRLLQSNAQSIARTFSSLLMPIVQKILPYINALAIAFRKLLEFIGNFLGIEFNTGSVAPDNSAISDYADSVDDASDAQSKAAKSAKEWKNQLMGFDEVNKLEDNSGSGGGGKGGNPTGGASGIQDLFDSMYDEYLKAWNESYQNMEQKANDLATKIQKAFTDAWKNSDGSNIGKSIAKWLNKGITKADEVVGKANKIFRKIALTVARGINGFVETLDWSGLGKVLGKGLKGAFEAERTFFKTVNWYNLGKNIADTVIAFLDSGAMESFAGAMGAKLRAIIQLAFGAITNFDFKDLGKHIGQSINTFFSEMSSVDEDTGLTGWQELGQTISDSVKGIADAISTALDTVDWDKVGKSIGEFLAKLDWIGILTKLGKVLAKALGAVLQTWFGSFKKAPISTTLITAFVAIGVLVRKSAKFKAMADLIASNIFTNIGNKIGSNALISGLGTKISSALSTATAGIGTTAGASVGASVVAAIGAAFVGWHLGQSIYNGLTTDENGDNVIDRFVARIGDAIKQAKDDLTSDPNGDGGGHSFKVKAEVDTTDADSKISTLTADKSTNVKVNATTTDKGKNTFKAINNLSGKTIKIPTELTPATAISETAKEWAKNFAKNFKPEWEMSINGKKVTVHQSTTMAYAVKHNANGGVFQNGKWSNIKKYAKGGIPTHGTMYVAGEAGSEIVGNVGNGKTEVLNMSQIQNAISNGVSVAVGNVMSAMMQKMDNMSSASAPIYMDSTLVTNAILQNAHNRKITNNGQNVFMTI